MLQICTCGAQLPPDARFCHQCGKPQRDEDIPRTIESPPPTPSQAPPTAPRVLRTGVNFRNADAVRIGLRMASFASLLSIVPYLNLGVAVWWTSAGFFSAYLYKRRTGQFLSVGSGLRLGWITGVLTFAIMTVLSTLTLVPLALRPGGLAAAFEGQLRSMPMNDPNLNQAMKMFESPGGMATIIVFTLLLLFAAIVILCTAGGALGAKLGGRG
jgi:hypothetical protein